MICYEYKVIPAPARGTKAKGVKTPEARFALSVESLLNVMGADGWEYQRAELLPSEERTGLTGSVTQWRNVLVFRRALAEGAAAPVTAEGTQPEPVAAPEPEDPAEPAQEADDGSTRARPIPGPDAMKAQLRAPAPISSPVKDPPLRVVKPETDED